MTTYEALVEYLAKVYNPCGSCPHTRGNHPNGGACLLCNCLAFTVREPEDKA
jgi:hypothetical protein